MATATPTPSRRTMLGFLLGAPATALAATASARQAVMVNQLSLSEINRKGLGSGIERDATLIETRLALHEYRIRHGKDHWRRYQLPLAGS